MKAPYPLIEIVWLDAVTASEGWEDGESAEVAVPEVMTIGFLIKETDAGYLIASTVCKEKTTNARITIPKGMMKTMKYLRGKPKAVLKPASIDLKNETPDL